MMDAADVVLTPMTLEITSMKNVRVFLEITEKLGYGEDKVQLIANRNDSSGGIKATDIESSLGRKIPHTIVSDGRTLVLAVNRGVPFVISHKDSQVRSRAACGRPASGRSSRRSSRPRASSCRRRSSAT
jgi:pilus assembly protein CpaE